MKKVQDMTLKEKVGQMIGLAFSGDSYSPELKMQVEDIEAGLIIYFKDNCVTPKQIFDLNKTINQHAKIAPFIAIDQEGGMVARVTEGIVQSPGAMAIGATQQKENAYQLAKNMGIELRHLGFNFNFAPVGDVNNNAKNPVINVRSYSEDPNMVADYMVEAIKGYHEAGLMTSVKHFPGHGDTAVDSHVGLPVVDFDKSRLDKMELVPFQKVIDLDLPGIMASHVLYTKYDDKYPTTLSKKIITGLLREEMGFKGLVVTDSLTMSAVFDNFSLEEIVYNGFNSGCDILLLCGARNVEMQKEFASIALRLAEEGKIPLEMIDASVERIMKYKEMYKVGEMANTFEDIQGDLEEPQRMEFAEKVAEAALTLVKNEQNLLPLCKNEKILVVFPKIKVVTLVENDDNTLSCLADYMPFSVDKHYVSIQPTETEQKELLEKIKKYDKVVYCSYNANFNPSQADLINQIDKQKIIVVAVRTPYDINVLDVPTYVCSYEASVLSFKALAKYLTGEIEAKGVLPVSIQ
ncbi:MAG: glycoside hydrolase family 3 protein [Prevotella sp.]|nr:glycoside hydrolase family 3 protein [Staphylococcus sp.]MCM1350962.1 glycoside hydrolase family 3 protein [Prevotella sp.]